MLVVRKPRSLSFKTESWFYVDVKPYQQRLIDLEVSLLSRTTRGVTTRREQSIGTAADAGDATVADESDNEDFTQAELDATILRQVHDALRRIENGTYGQCLIDGAPIDPNASTLCRGRRIASDTRSYSMQRRGHTTTLSTPMKTGLGCRPCRACVRWCAGSPSCRGGRRALAVRNARPAQLKRVRLWCAALSLRLPLRRRLPSPECSRERHGALIRAD
jgi:RNA polymerase-binding transcription factor DksA